MSKQAILYLTTIGGLGEYFRRKKNPLFSDPFNCMHLGPFQEHSEFGGCSQQPLLYQPKHAFYAEELFEDSFILNSSRCCL